MIIRLSHLFLLAAGLACAAPAARAQNGQPEGDDNRYTFNRADDGYLRLDGRTGQVSLCTRRTVGWACQTVADERSALESEIARLQNENVALKRELLAHNLPLPGVVKPEPPVAKNVEPPSDADLNKMMSFVEKVWRRMVEMIVTLQKDVLKKS
jgi:hypothetical protein